MKNRITIMGGMSYSQKLKLTVCLFIFSLLQIKATTYFQNEKITLQLQNSTIEKVLQEIENNTNFNILYNHNEIDYTKIISVNFKNASVSTILKSIFSETKITYEILDKQIILKLNPNKQGIKSSSKKRKVSGVVKDQNDLPLPGVNILIKGTRIGTVTDFDGKYEITIPQSENILIFSYIGQKTQEIAIENKDVINVIMTQDLNELEEVVLIGYGSSKRKDLTGAISSVNASTIQEQPSLRFQEAIQGKVAGVLIQRTSGAPDGSLRVRIRGANSIIGDNNPLYVIDGFLGADINSINVNDIESIEVLKDASATAIYGSRGSNGVILVTTKSAKAGKISWSLNTRTGFDKLIKEIDTPTPVEFMRIVNLSDVNNGSDPSYSEEDILAFQNDPSKGTNWVDEVYRTALKRDYQLSAQGGTKNNRFYLSGNYNDIEAIIRNDNYKRYGLRSNLDFKLNKKVKIKTNINLARIERETTGVRPSDPFFYSPLTEVFDEIGEYTVPSSIGTQTVNNPAYSINERRRKNITNQISLLTNLDIKLFRGLKYNFTGAAESNTTDRSSFDRFIPGQSPSSSVAITGNTENVSWQVTNRLTFDKNFGSNHYLNLTGAQEAQYRKSSGNTYRSTGFGSIGLGANDLGLASSTIASTNTTGNNNASFSLASFIGRLNYTYKDKYLFTGSLRADGSSKFAKQNKWSYFPSAAVSWKLNKEDFLKDIKQIDLLKLRVSYGQVGSQAIEPDATVTELFVPALGIPISEGAISNAIPIGDQVNKDLRWEVTDQFDLGIDLQMFSGRLNVTADYYYKETSDLLFNTQIPDFSGSFSGSLLENIGRMSNQGIELLLDVTAVKTEDFSINVALNYAKNENKFLGIGGDDSDIPITSEQYSANTFAGIVPFVLQKGQPLANIRGLIYEGPYRTEDQALADLHGYSLGAPRFRDVNNDGEINAEDAVVIGNGAPDYTLGLNVNMTYKNFDMSLFVQSVQGFDIINIDRYFSTRGFTNTELLNAWSITNEASNQWAYARNSFDNPGNTQYVEDGSFVRLKNITLGYSLPKKVLSKTKLQDCRFFINAQNVFTITDYKGADPEASATGNRDLSQGVNSRSFPNAKSISFGANFKF